MIDWTLLCGSLLLTVAVWWGATGIIAWLIGRSVDTYPALLRGTLAIGLIALVAVLATRDVQSVAGAAVSFLGAIGIWAGIEVSFLTGRVTGLAPRASATTYVHGWRHAIEAIRVILWHELLIIGVVAMIAALTLDADNRVALGTLLLLWLMRSSAKINLFLGVRNLGEAFLPQHLTHLLRYMQHRRMNLLFPFSIALGGLIVWWLGSRALQADSGFSAAGYTILTTLAALAVLEHVLMVLPMPSERFWRWSLANRQGASRP
jgi:putative photosynthetic complex assembly protein 2